MALFFIAYDLDKPDRNYKAVYSLLEKWGAERILESIWAMKSDSTVQEIRKAMKAPKGPIVANDRLLVVQELHWASFRLMTSINKF